jgi:hypothetical protein
MFQIVSSCAVRCGVGISVRTYDIDIRATLRFNHPSRDNTKVDI